MPLRQMTHAEVKQSETCCPIEVVSSRQAALCVEARPSSSCPVKVMPLKRAARAKVKQMDACHPTEVVPLRRAMLSVSKLGHIEPPRRGDALEVGGTC